MPENKLHHWKMLFRNMLQKQKQAPNINISIILYALQKANFSLTSEDLYMFV